MKADYGIYYAPDIFILPDHVSKIDHRWKWVGTANLCANEDHICTDNLYELREFLLTKLDVTGHMFRYGYFVLEYFVDSDTNYTHSCDIYSLKDCKYICRIFIDDNPMDTLEFGK